MDKIFEDSSFIVNDKINYQIDNQVSVFIHAKSTAVFENISLRAMLNRINSDFYKEQVLKARQLDTNNYKVFKTTNIPAFTMSCTCKTRKASDVIKHTGVLQIDIDNIDNVLDVKNKIIQDKYILFCFVSLSGKGLKAAIKINADKHLNSFLTAEQYFKEKYDIQIDKACKDIARLCFISHDTNIFINENSCLFELEYKKDIQKTVFKADIEYQSTDKDFNGLQEQVLKAAKNILNVCLGYRHDARLRAGRLLGGYVASGLFSKDFALNAVMQNVLNNTDNSVLATKEIEKFIEEGTKSPISLDLELQKRQEFLNNNAVVFCKNCNKQIYFKNKKPFSNKECTQKHNCLLDTIVKNTEDKFDYSKLPFCFWYENSKGELKVLYKDLMDFIDSHGFKRRIIGEEINEEYIKITQNIVNKTSIKIIRSFVLKEITKLPFIISKSYNRKNLQDFFIKGIENYINEAKTAALDLIDIKFLRDSHDASYHFFENGFVEITKDNIELKEYKDLPGFIWQSQIINKKFNYDYDYEQSSFYKFCKNICTQKNENFSYGEPVTISKFDEKRFESLKTVIGKILHNYSIHGNQQAFIFCESAFDFGDKPEGGAGKGILLQALDKIRKVTEINGKTFDPDNRFRFQEKTEDTQIIAIDDVKKSFNYQSIFSDITNGMTVEEKNKPSVKNGIENNVKFIVTTNYAIKETSGSFDRRFFIFELTTYYNINYSPEQDFGFLWGKDWQESDWNLFYSFMFECIKTYFNNEKKVLKYESGTLIEKRKIAAIGEDLYQYFETLEKNTIYYKDDVYTEFKNNYTNAKNKPTKNIFGRKLTEYCEFKKYQLENGLKKENGKVCHYYIINKA